MTVCHVGHRLYTHRGVYKASKPDVRGPGFWVGTVLSQSRKAHNNEVRGGLQLAPPPTKNIERIVRWNMRRPCLQAAGSSLFWVALSPSLKSHQHDEEGGRASI